MMTRRQKIISLDEVAQKHALVLRIPSMGDHFPSIIYRFLLRNGSSTSPQKTLKRCEIQRFELPPQVAINTSNSWALRILTISIQTEDKRVCTVDLFELKCVSKPVFDFSASAK